ncbi:lysophospholipid acyltransferase family protein [Shimia sagamensis]|uniref:1-acyl-sn-glycerol-3-phosphate acyltransferase n=1 Tax=Shimia sagamensis TaxID=1566352 RepID=A0ABY1NHX1_9RHOB|nr:lysophospholipid acyltransferase family protein [Shimia sagamensis]SMP08144.1 1-acyl-sn-glycerol-3-phosphate acyltransferase [Shimia sagamensis]
MHRLQQSFPVVFVRSLLFYALAGLAAVPFLLCWPALRGPRRTVYAIADRYLRVMLWLLRGVCGIRYRVVGQDRLPEGAVLIASQHESTWETLFFQVLFDHPVMYAKTPIFSYPVFGPVVRKFGHIPVAAGASADAMRAAFRAGAAAVKDGRSLVIFPSGTRRKDTAELQAGVGVLYQLAGVKVVPVRLNSGTMWPHGQWLKFPGTIEVQIAPVIEAGLDRRDFMQILSASLADDHVPVELENL